MKKLFVAALSVAMITLTSISIFAVPTNSSVSGPSKLNAVPYVLTQNDMAPPIAVTAAELPAEEPATTGYLCPNGNADCVQNGACLNNGECQYPNGCPNKGTPKQNQTESHNQGHGRGQQGKGRGNCRQ